MWTFISLYLLLYTGKTSFASTIEKNFHHNTVSSHIYSILKKQAVTTVQTFWPLKVVCHNYCIRHIFRVQIFPRFWTRWANSQWLNFAIFVMFSLQEIAMYLKLKFSWKLTRENNHVYSTQHRGGSWKEMW